MNFLKIKLLVVAIVMFAANSAFASLGFDVTINTSSLTSYAAGALYLQYNPINGADSTVTLSNFTMGDNSGLIGTRATYAEINGNAVSGTLPGNLVFANTNGINDYSHELDHFADSISFHLAFSNPAAGGADGGSSTFSLGLFYDVYGTPIFGNPALLTIDLLNDGTAVVQTTQDIPTTVTPTPIPAAFWLIGSGLMGLVGIRRKNNV